MLFPRRQTADGIHDFSSRQAHRVSYGHAFKHLRQCGAASKRGRTAISQKSRCFDPAVINPQTQPQAIATNRIRFLSNGVRVGQFSRIAGLSEVIFEGF